MDVRHTTTPIVAIVGRTNVGKSTLFNRLTEKNMAMTSAEEHTTQDVKFGLCEWQGDSFTIIDTAGLDMSGNETDVEALRKQATSAMEKAHIIYFLVDATSGVLPQDIAMAQFLRKSDKPVFLIANKADSPGKRKQVLSNEYQKLGFGDIHAISAANSSGVGDLLEFTIKELTALGKKTVELPDIDVRVAIIGRPNVGKSSLLNALAGEERCIVSEVAHTTKEPQDTLISFDHPTHGEKHVLFIDTVGIRKKGKVKRGMESLGIHLSIEEMKRADVTLLMVDAEQGVEAQEKKLAGLIEDKNVGVLVVVNKWDLSKDNDDMLESDEYRKYVARQLPFYTWAPVTFMSAKTGKHVDRVLDLVLEIAASRKREIPQEDLDKFLEKLKKKHGHMIQGGPNKPRVFGITQTNTEPPEFTIVTRKKDTIHTNFIRFIANRIREEFGFEGVPLRVSSRDLKK